MMTCLSQTATEEMLSLQRQDDEINYDTGEFRHEVQFITSSFLERASIEQTVVPSTDEAQRAMLHSQSGPNAR